MKLIKKVLILFYLVSLSNSFNFSLYNCLEFDLNGGCLKCKDGFNQKNKLCYLECNLPNCEQCLFTKDGNSYCGRCTNNYYFDNILKSCLTVPSTSSANNCNDKNCLHCTGNTCKKCYDKYMINENGSCICPIGTFLSNLKCNSCSETYGRFCNECNNTKCLKCLSPFCFYDETEARCVCSEDFSSQCLFFNNFSLGLVFDFKCFCYNKLAECSLSCKSIYGENQDVSCDKNYAYYLNYDSKEIRENNIYQCNSENYFDLVEKKCKSCDSFENNNTCKICNNASDCIALKTGQNSVCPSNNYFFNFYTNTCLNCKQIDGIECDLKFESEVKNLKNICNRLLNCETCDDFGCKKCKNGYFLYQTTFENLRFTSQNYLDLNYLKNLQISNQNEIGIYLPGTCQQCTFYDKNCVECNERFCLKCNDGFTISPFSTCIPNFSTNSISLVNIYKDNKCQKSNTNCLYCPDSIKCLICEKQFFNYSCFGKICKIENCDLCSETAEDCKKCKIGFSSKNKSCSQNDCSFISNCKYCDEKICIQCKENYFWNGKECLSNIVQNCNIANCTKCQLAYRDNKSIEECITCDTSYFNNQGIECSKCPVSCKQCSSSNICTECNPGYNYSNFTCQPENQAQTKNVKSSACNIEYCKICDAVKNKCTKCDINYLISKDRCVKSQLGIVIGIIIGTIIGIPSLVLLVIAVFKPKSNSQSNGETQKVQDNTKISIVNNPPNNIIKNKTIQDDNHAPGEDGIIINNEGALIKNSYTLIKNNQPDISTAIEPEKKQIDNYQTIKPLELNDIKISQILKLDHKPLCIFCKSSNLYQKLPCGASICPNCTEDAYMNLKNAIYRKCTECSQYIFEFYKGENNEIDPSLPICLVCFEANANVAIPCNFKPQHSVHSNCLIELINTTNKCPGCDSPFELRN